MTAEGLGEMFEGDSADMCAGKFPLVSMGGRVEGLECADPVARTPIGPSGIFFHFHPKYYLILDLLNTGFVLIFHLAQLLLLTTASNKIIIGGIGLKTISYLIGE